jgi:hypothetical protein
MKLMRLILGVRYGDMVKLATFLRENYPTPAFYQSQV